MARAGAVSSSGVIGVAKALVLKRLTQKSPWGVTRHAWWRWMTGQVRRHTNTPAKPRTAGGCAGMVWDGGTWGGKGSVGEGCG